MKASKVIETLEAEVARLSKFKDEDLAAFVLIIPPVGSTIKFISMDEQADETTFFNTLSARIKNTLEESQRGGVQVAGYPRR